MTKDKEEFSILRELWFPLLFGFILLVLMAGGYFLAAADTKTKTAKVQTSKELSKNVIIFLNDLKNGDPQDAYESVSKDFKDAMPYPKFVQFLSDYPILTAFEKIEPSVATLDGQTVVFPVVLNIGTTLFPLKFTLVKEDGEWKILGFVINQMISGQDLRDLDSIKPLSAIAYSFLVELKENHLDNAYEDFTTDDFKKGTTQKMFVQYVKDRPIFQADSNSIQVIDGHLDGGRGYLKMNIKNGDQIYPVDFTLHEEKGGWRIEGVYLLAPATDQKTTIQPPTPQAK